MTTSVSGAMLIALALGALPLHSSAQQPPPPTDKIKGQVVSVTGNTVRVRLPTGTVQAYAVEGAARSRLKDVKPGYRIEATLETDASGRAVIVGFSEISVGPGPQPSRSPGTEQGPRRSRLLVTTDLACDVSVDFKKVATLPAGGHTTLEVDPGERLVSAVAPDGRAWRQKVKVSGEQAIVEILLAKEPPPASPAEFDSAAASVVAALADVRGAGSHVAWVLEKKAFGYHDVQLTVSLQRASTRLKRELDKLQGLQPPDAERRRAREDLARAGGEAAPFAALLTDAATTAQSEGTSFGKSAQLRGQALAHLPLMPPDAGALAVLQSSEAFRGALSPDRWPDAGLAADAQDFRLGADYDGDTPPRLGAVVKGGLAEALGLRPGDRLMAVDGRPVQSGWAFKLALRAAAGRTVQLELEREGKRETRKASVPANLGGSLRK